MAAAEKKELSCYCITNGRRTYVGATKNFRRRLRQHNQEIKGGAKATRCTPGEWRLLVRVVGFETWRDVLKFEWRWKHIRRYRRGQDPVKRRFRTLDLTLDLWRHANLQKVFPPTTAATLEGEEVEPPQKKEEEDEEEGGQCLK